ncbi:hypothetical protein PsorP6_006918 [Peronosclerospora sorghi]|uniref:Uncharacterized protein n=1 Tax=Peronosclerospora sorghi TaxID=230839 RepID=A0ACC0W8V5_9STRA|nr:hypothetical protein PsorP6_006918 [Peronosclerospora sorghi]
MEEGVIVTFLEVGNRTVVVFQSSTDSLAGQLVRRDEAFRMVAVEVFLPALVQWYWALVIFIDFELTLTFPLRMAKPCAFEKAS